MHSAHHVVVANQKVLADVILNYFSDISEACLEARPQERL